MCATPKRGGNATSSDEANPVGNFQSGRGPAVSLRVRRQDFVAASVGSFVERGLTRQSGDIAAVVRSPAAPKGESPSDAHVLLAIRAGGRSLPPKHHDRAKK